MERWAKMLNQKKESAKHAKEVALAQQMAAISAKTGSADAGFAVLQGKSTVDALTSMSSTPLSILANESRPAAASAPSVSLFPFEGVSPLKFIFIFCIYGTRYHHVSLCPNQHSRKGWMSPGR